MNALLNDLHDTPVAKPQSAVTVAAVPLGWAHPPPLPLAPRLLLGPNRSACVDDDDDDASTATCTAAAAASASAGVGSVNSVPQDSVLDPLDTLLLADVIYDPDLYVPLVSTLQALVPYIASSQETNSADVSSTIDSDGVEATGNLSTDSRSAPLSIPPPPAVVLAYRHRNPEDFRFWAALHAAGFDTTKVVDNVAPAAGNGSGVSSDGTPNDVVVYQVVRSRAGTEDIAAVASAALKPPGPPGPQHN